jgi:hypothetical protein
MDGLSIFGLFAVTTMLVCYALESRSHWFILGFRGSLRARLGVWISAGSMAVRRRRGDLVRYRFASVAAQLALEHHRLSAPLDPSGRLAA